MKKYFSVGSAVLMYLAIYSFFQIIGIFLMAEIIKFYNIFDIKPQQLDTVDWINDEVLIITIIFSAIVSFLIYAWIVKASKKKNIFDYCNFKHLPLNKVAVTIFVGLSLVSLNGITVVIISFIFPDAYNAHVENMMALTSSGGWLMVISVGLAAPFIEEVMFRGLITNELNKLMSYKWVIFVQALLFGLYHMNLVQGIYTFILAIFMGYILYWTKSIWAPLIIHIVNNLSSVIMSEYLDPNSDILNIGFGIWMIFSLIFVLPYTLKYLHKSRIVVDAEESIIERV